MTDFAELPTMRGLTEKQRTFVLAMASEPFASAASWARCPSMAVAALMRLAANPDHKDHGKAVIALADRVGFVATQEIHVKHTDETGDALMARLEAVAERLGLDAKKLIGSNVIEGEKVETKGATA